jgi:phage gp36-like protein
MAYATISDVFKRYQPLQTVVGSGGTRVPSADVTSIFIADAESIVNAYLASRYSIPLVAEPLVTMVTADIAIYRIEAQRLVRTPDFLKDRYTEALSLLVMLRDGEMTLGSASITSSGNQEAFSTTSGYHSTFSPILDDLDQSVDQDWVTAERDSRVTDL